MAYLKAGKVSWRPVFPPQSCNVLPKSSCILGTAETKCVNRSLKNKLKQKSQNVHSLSLKAISKTTKQVHFWVCIYSFMFVHLFYVGSLLIPSFFLTGSICFSLLLPNLPFFPRLQIEKIKRLSCCYKVCLLPRFHTWNRMAFLSCPLTGSLIFSNAVVLKLECVFRTWKSWWKTYCWAQPPQFLIQ